MPVRPWVRGSRTRPLVLTWAPLTYTDEHPPHRDNPVAPARRSRSAGSKDTRKTSPGNQPIRSFRDLLDHLATLTATPREREQRLGNLQHHVHQVAAKKPAGAWAGWGMRAGSGSRP